MVSLAFEVPQEAASFEVFKGRRGFLCVFVSVCVCVCVSVCVSVFLWEWKRDSERSFRSIAFLTSWNPTTQASGNKIGKKIKTIEFLKQQNAYKRRQEGSLHKPAQQISLQRLLQK